MNGPVIDHREMAERCMDRASRTEESDRGASLYWLQRAQVHATLAGPSTRTIEFVSRPPEADSGLRDLLSAARVAIHHARVKPDDRAITVVRTADFRALIEQVEEATEAGL